MRELANEAGIICIPPPPRTTKWCKQWAYCGHWIDIEAIQRSRRPVSTCRLTYWMGKINMSSCEAYISSYLGPGRHYELTRLFSSGTHQNIWLTSPCWTGRLTCLFWAARSTFLIWEGRLTSPCGQLTRKVIMEGRPVGSTHLGDMRLTYLSLVEGWHVINHWLTTHVGIKCWPTFLRNSGWMVRLTS